MGGKHAIELLRLRVPVAASYRALTTDEDLQRKGDAVAAVVGQRQRERRLREVVDGAIEVPEIEIRPSPLGCVKVRRRIVARPIEADEDRRKLSRQRRGHSATRRRGCETRQRYLLQHEYLRCLQNMRTTICSNWRTFCERRKP